MSVPTELEMNELLVQVSKYMEFYSYQANREALTVIFNTFYKKAFEAGFNDAVSVSSPTEKST